jgi:dihydrofolate synthase / folylpolyglutamate synthase
VAPLTYQRLVAELFPRLSGGIRWGVERTARLLAGVGDPHRSYATLHIGGTNGKGSVAAMLAAVLQRSGVRTGLYTSPHLCDFRERFRLDGVPLSPTAVVTAAERLWPAIREADVSFFEATTAIGFLALADAGAELVVTEVGLGGRLDATNVVTPLVAVITNVEYDHMQYLGTTLESIAGEKAGIVKRGVPVVTAESAAAPLAVLRAAATAADAPFVALTDRELADIVVSPAGTRFRLDSTAWGALEVATPLIGVHQARNAALAVRTLELLPAALRPSAAAVLDGLRGVSWPGRMQHERIDGRDWYFDVAHNAAGMRALADALIALRPPRPVAAVVGVLGDKDWLAMLGPLAGVADRLILTVPPGAPADRRWDPDAVLAALPALPAIVHHDFATALSSAPREGASVVVTGSFHTVGDALRALGRAP